MMNGRQCCLHSRSPARETKRPTCEATERARRRQAARAPVSRSDVISAGARAVNNYCWGADGGRATRACGGERLLQVAGQLAERGVIVSARHERSRACPREGARELRERGRCGGLRGNQYQMERVRRSRAALGSPKLRLCGGPVRASETPNEF